jgi:hypothetical protein
MYVKLRGQLLKRQWFVSASMICCQRGGAPQDREWDGTPPAVPRAKRLNRHGEQVGEFTLRDASRTPKLSQRIHANTMGFFRRVVKRSPGYQAGGHAAIRLERDDVYAVESD